MANLDAWYGLGKDGAPALRPDPATVPSTVEQMYGLGAGGANALRPAPAPALKTNTVQTVAIDPFTGNPINAGGNSSMPATSNALAYQGTNHPALQKQSGAQYFPQSPGVEYGYNNNTGVYEVKQPGQAYVSVPFPKGTTIQQPAVQAATAVASAKPNSIFSGWQKPPAQQGGGVHPLTFNPSAIGAQNMANSRGAPIRTASGQLYTPMAGLGPPASANPQVAAAMASQPVGMTPVQQLQAQGMSAAQAYAVAAAPAHSSGGRWTSSDPWGSSSGSSNGGSLI